jgi:hypothetical protein
VSDPRGFVERYSPWTGRAWLEVVGTPRTVPFGPGYGAVKKGLRAEWPDRPWESDWMDGTFEAAPWGRPLWPVLGAAAVGAGATIAAATAFGGGPAAVATAAVFAWPLLRLLDHVSVNDKGIRVGPAWSLRIPWSEVEAVGLSEGLLWVRGVHHGAAAHVPPALAPVVRARIRRFGGLSADRTDGGQITRYARFRAAAAGLPPGVLVGVLAAMALHPEPFRVLFVGGLVVVALAALGAAAEARATGWGAGSVFWLTVVHGIALAAFAIGR